MSRRVPYGSPSRPRRNWLPLLAILFAPVVAGASWMLWPFWFVPLHEATWGPANMSSVSHSVAALHVSAIFVLICLLIGTVFGRWSDGRWWWQPKARAEQQ